MDSHDRERVNFDREHDIIAAMFSHKGLVQSADAAFLKPDMFDQAPFGMMLTGMRKLASQGVLGFTPAALCDAMGVIPGADSGFDPNGEVLAWRDLVMRLYKAGAPAGEAFRVNVANQVAQFQHRRAAEIYTRVPNGHDPVEAARLAREEAEALYRDTPSRGAFKLVSFADWKKSGKPPDYLVKGMLQRGYIYALTGLTGAGKTAVALRLALSVAAGTRFGRHQCKPGRVVYLAGENPDDLRFRCLAIGAIEDIAEANLSIVEGTYSIADVMPQADGALRAIGGCDLLIVDTSPAFFFGDAGLGENPENNNSAMGEHAKTLRRLTRLPGHPTVIALCHPKLGVEEESLNPRGASSFKNEMDGNLTLWKHDETMTRLGQNKMRGVPFVPVEFNLDEVRNKACVDADGEEMPQVNATFADDRVQNEREREQRADEDLVILGLGDGKDGPAICLEQGWMKDGEPERWRIQKIVKRIPKLVTNERGRYRLTSKPDGGGAKVYEKLKDERDEQAAVRQRWND